MTGVERTRATVAAFAVFVLLGLTPVFLNLLGLDLGTARPLAPASFAEATRDLEFTDALDARFRNLAGPLIHHLLEWSAFGLGLSLFVLALIHFRVTRRLSTTVLCLGIFCAGVIDAFHTLAAARLVEAAAPTRDVIPFTWTLGRLFKAGVLTAGVGLLLSLPARWLRASWSAVGVAALILGAATTGAIRFSLVAETVPRSIFARDPVFGLLARPYDVLALVLFLVAGAGLLPALRRRDRSAFSLALIASVLLEIGTQLYAVLAWERLFDNGFVAAHILKVGAYLLPLLGLSIDHVRDTAAREIEKSKESFVSTVSHELRTPLTSILGSLGILDSQALCPLNAEAKQLTQLAERNCRRLIGIVNEILDFQNLTSESFRPVVREVRTEELVRAAREMVGAFADERGITLDVHCEAERIRADGDRLTQVLVNLLSNAVKFSPAGETVRLECRCSRGRWRVRVLDRGAGVPAPLRAKVFEAFHRIDSPHAQKIEGSGLGLAICEKIVATHGGAIGVRGREGGGSEFWFEVPVAPPECKGPEVR